ncbi:TPA: hypothetical protein ACH3X2_011331 [Trebouxia sp. C0005]|nr:MAG: magnesium-protoporphyrin IX methyltransferase chloroplast precursor [Trebouxia sp. A1-2]
MLNIAAETVPSSLLLGNLLVVRGAKSNQTQRRRAHCTVSQSKNQSHDNRITSINRLKIAATLLTAQQIACEGSAHASEAVSSLAEASATLPIALGGGAAIAALSAALIATDPQKRRTAQTATAGGSEKDSVKSYFDGTGFERWNRIYGSTDDVNKVQLDIRTGHQQTVDKVLHWFDEEGGVKGTSVCDAGCGTGSLSLPLALRGAAVSASDISSSMANEAQRRYEQAVSSGEPPAGTPPTFSATDLESISGSFHTVVCLDVMIHYPQDKANGMIKHLASLAEDRLIISFAPKTLAYSILKRIGELFPGPSKATRAYLHAEADVEAALQQAGFKVTKREMTATSFYFSRLLEAKRS